MMPASTTLASSQPRWGDQKAPITAAPKTSQNPFRHLVGRGAVRKREQEVAGRTRRSPCTDQSGRPSLVIAIVRWSSRAAAGFRLVQKMAALNKCLARSNKSCTRAQTNKRAWIRSRQA